MELAKLDLEILDSSCEIIKGESLLIAKNVFKGKFGVLVVTGPPLQWHSKHVETHLRQ